MSSMRKWDMWAITASCWSFNLGWSMYTFQHIPRVLLQKAWEYKGNSTRFRSPVYANLQFTEHRTCAEGRLHVFKVNIQVLVYVCVCDACNSIIFLLFFVVTWPNSNSNRICSLLKSHLNIEEGPMTTTFNCTLKWGLVSFLLLR